MNIENGKQSAVLAVDIGTTALKAAIMTRTGNLAAYSKQPLTQGNKAALGWIKALQKAILEMSNTPLASNIAAICISGNGPTLVSPDGTTLLWNAPAEYRCFALQSSLLQRGENTRMGSIFLPRIMAFRKMYPDKELIMSGPEYLAYKLTGRAVTVLPEARYQSAYWDDDTLDALGVERGILPPFIAPTDKAGTLKADAAAELGLPLFAKENKAACYLPPVFCTGPDFIAAMIGTASLEEGRMYDCAGSSEGVNLAVSGEWLKNNRQFISPAFRVLPSLAAGLWNIAVMIPESGSIFVNYRRVAEAILDRELPYRMLIDKCLKNRDSDGYEILKHIASNFSRAVNALLALSPRACLFPIIVTGGQAQNEKWMQLKCNEAKASLAVMKCIDAELMGDNAVAWTGLGEYISLQEAVKAVCKVDKVYEAEIAD